MNENTGRTPVPDAYRQSAEDVLTTLGADPSAGLDQAEVQRRLARHGANLLAEARRRPAWRRLAAQFTDALVVLLIVAASISALLWYVERDGALPYEAIAIFAIVLLNAFMGYIQQARAEQTLAGLKEMSVARARVVRDGMQQNVVAAELVPGDVIVIEEGDTVPADARLIRVSALQTAEAALTGESVPVAKNAVPLDAEAVLGDRSNMVFRGTSVASGRGRAVVTATGMRTEIGRIAGLLEATPEDKTPLQRELDRVGKLLGIVVIAIAIAMIATIALVGGVSGASALFDVLIVGVALAVAAVPEGLPAVVTVVLSLGVQRMAARNAIVRQLAAVETLGSADVIASDKTGTLTRSEMTVRAVVTAAGRTDMSGTGYAPEGDVSPPRGAGAGASAELERALVIAERANNAELRRHDGRWTLHGDPTEGALLVAARKAGLDPEELGRRFPRIAEIPFSSERKLMSTVHADAANGERLMVMTKGAPGVLLERCTAELADGAARPLTDARRAEILAANEAMAGEALRTLGLAFRELPAQGFDADTLDARVEQNLVFAGLVGMIDPPRPEAGEAAARAKRAGIRAIMITGDHPTTASVIARELGIAADGRALSGTELDGMTDEELDAVVGDVSVYARVNPVHKLRIVEALQRLGMTVAMTGDGVNDAPALKAADIGVAMGITGTDVSKQAGDIVLTDDNFASIVAAVEEGRAIFANIRKFLRYLLSSNIGEVMTMFFGVVLADAIGLTAAAAGAPLALPLLATQILWVNLVTDGAPALALGLDPPDERTMRRPPRPPGEGVITRRMWRGIFFVGAIMMLGTLLVLDASLPGGFVEGAGSLEYGQTMAFNTLVLFNVFNVFNARSDDRSAFADLFTNAWVGGAVLLSLSLQAAVVYTPFLQRAFSTVALDAGDWALCAAVASSVLWLREIQKGLGRLRRASPSAVGVSAR
ncbi:MAG: cation-translocating P-type ATPase [Gammaproteobacteria bacterium]|nr:cation-translocating P-type ATPase [Gammaproteobacteria bacterium]